MELNFDLNSECQVIALAQLISEFRRQMINATINQNGMSVTVRVGC